MHNGPITVERVTSNIGARVGGLDLAGDITDEQFAAVREALLEHLVVFFTGQNADASAQRRLTERFGPLRVHPVQEFLGGTDAVGVVGTAAYGPEGDSHFHTDHSFHTDIPDVAVLRAVVIPDRGGDTLWSNMYAALDALSEPMRAFLRGLTAVHDQGPAYYDHIRRHHGRDHADTVLAAFPGAAHPVVPRHPETGRELLFVNPGYTRSIVGLTRAESDALLDMLFRHVGQARFTVRHRWAPGDIAIWDERCTLHMGEAAYWPAERELRRLNAGRFTPAPVS